MLNKFAGEIMKTIRLPEARERFQSWSKNHPPGTLIKINNPAKFHYKGLNVHETIFFADTKIVLLLSVKEVSPRGNFMTFEDRSYSTFVEIYVLLSKENVTKVASIPITIGQKIVSYNFNEHRLITINETSSDYSQHLSRFSIKDFEQHLQKIGQL